MRLHDGHLKKNERIRFNLKGVYLINYHIIKINHILIHMLYRTLSLCLINRYKVASCFCCLDGQNLRLIFNMLQSFILINNHDNLHSLRTHHVTQKSKLTLSSFTSFITLSWVAWWPNTSYSLWPTSLSREKRGLWMIDLLLFNVLKP